MSRSQFLKVWSVVVGAMNAITGLLLMLIPGLALNLIGVPRPSPDSQVFLSWMGGVKQSP